MKPSTSVLLSFLPRPSGPSSPTPGLFAALLPLFNLSLFVVLLKLQLLGFSPFGILPASHKTAQRRVTPAAARRCQYLASCDK